MKFEGWGKELIMEIIWDSQFINWWGEPGNILKKNAMRLPIPFKTSYREHFLK